MQRMYMIGVGFGAPSAVRMACGNAFEVPMTSETPFPTRTPRSHIMSKLETAPRPTRIILPVLFAFSILALTAWTARATTPPVTLAVTELGHGPALVFLPDMGLGRNAWMPTARRLLPGHTIVLVDLPGHGESGMPDPFSL